MAERSGVSRAAPPLGYRDHKHPALKGRYSMLSWTENPFSLPPPDSIPQTLLFSDQPLSAK